MTKQTTSNNPDLYLLTVSIYLTALTLRPILASKILSLGGINIPGAILVFPLSFVCNDIFSEIYGFKKSRAIVTAGLIMQLLSIFTISLVGILPAADFWDKQLAYDSILGQSPQIAAASLIGYYFGELTNSYIISRMKYVDNGKSGKKLVSRFVISTLIGEIVDSILFFSLGFAFTYKPAKILEMIINSWILKTSYEILLLPLSTKITLKIKQLEDTDIIDSPNHTNYSFLKW